MNKIITLMLVLLGTGTWLSAQVNGYTFAESTEVYAQITGTTSTAVGDDGTQIAIPIGFNFTFDGVVRSTFSITTNGMIRLDGAAIGSGWTNSLSTTSTNRPLIAPFWDDNNLNTGTIRYATTGTPGTQVLTVNWHNSNIGGGGSTAGAQVSYLVRLYEGTNAIEMVYGSPFTTTNTVSASVGLNGASTFLSVTPAATSTASGVTANNAINATVMANLAGKKLTFTPPACLSVSALTATVTSGTTVSVNWTNGGAETMWDLYYGPSPLTAPTAGTTPTLDNTPTKPAVLTIPANTPYQVYVRADCGGAGPGAWSSALSVTITAPPYLQDFNGTYLPSGWSEAQSAFNATPTGTSSGWTSDNWANVASGQNAAKINIFGTGTGLDDEWLISPTISIPAGPAHQAEFDLGFFVFGAGTLAPLDANDSFRFLISTDGGTSYTSLQTWTITDGPVSANFIYDLSAYAGMNVKFGFWASNGGATAVPSQDNDVMVDNFRVRIPPSCGDVTALAATVTSASNVNLTWTGSGAEALWDIYVGPTPLTAPTAGTTPTVDNHASTTLGFSPALNTPHQFYVRSDCNPGAGAWAGPISFQILGAPYLQDFDGAYLPTGWTEAQSAFNATPTGTTSGWTSDNWGNITSGETAAKINIFGSGTTLDDEWLISPSIAIPASPTYQAEFDLGFFDFAATTIAPLDANDSFRFMISTDGGVTFTTLQLWTIADGAVNSNFVYDMSGYAGQLVKFGFWGSNGLATATPSEDNDVMVNNFKVIQPPTCPKPTALAVSGVTGISANVSWTENGPATSWDLYYGVTPLTAPTGATVPTLQNVSPNNPYPLTGLTANSSYQLYVRADCGVSDSSLWVGPVSFTTPCNAIAAPYIENFDAAATIPACWSQSAVLGGPWIFSNTTPAGAFCSTGLVDHTTGTGRLAAVDMSGTDADVILTSPVIDVTTLTTPALSFWYNACNTDDPSTINTVAVEAFDGVSTWAQVGLIDFLTTGWEEQIFNVSSFTYGSGLVQVRFRVNANSPLGQPFVSDVHIDDFSIAEAPTCTPTVEGITVSNINNDGAVVSWDINIWNAAEAYTVNYGPALEFNSGALAAGVTTFTLSGLNTDEVNLVQVIADCGAIGNSSFTTLTCDSSAQCTYTLTLNDVTGDGWNWGEYLEITNGNQETVQYSIPSGACVAPCETVFTFKSCPADDILVQYVTGINGQAGDNENYWNLSGPNGFNYTQAPATSSVNSFGACPTCPAPFSPVVSNSCEDGVDLAWINGAVYDTVIVETSFFDSNIFAFTIERDTIVGSPNSYSVTGGTWGLSAGVDYQIIGICSNGDQGAISGSFTSPACNCSEQCAYEVILTDSWGDGWDGGSFVEVFQDGILTHTLTLVDGDLGTECSGGPGGCSQSYTVNVCPDLTVDFVYTYTSGDFNAEQSFQVVAPYSSPTAVFSSGLEPTTGTTYSEIACPPCPAPTTLSCASVDYQSVDVDFNSWNAGATYTVYYNTVDDFFSATAGASGTSVSGANTVTQTGLSGSTTYYFWVAEDCSGFPSAELGSSSCITPAACPAPTAFSCEVVGPDDILLEFTAGGVGNGYSILVNTVDDEGTATVQNTGTTVAGVNQVLQGGFGDGTYYFWVIEDCGVVLGTSLTTGSTSCAIDSGALSCDWIIDIADDFGDGWDGAFLTLTVNGTPTDYTTAGATDSYTVSIPDGASVELSYTAGSYETEHSYVITRPDGSTFADGPSPSVGVVLTETNVCAPPVFCDWTIDIADDFGDGWDGAFLTFSVDGSPTDYTTTGSNDQYIVSVMEGSTVDVTYTAGDYETEHSYVITRPDGTTFADGPSPTPGLVLSETSSCPPPALGCTWTLVINDSFGDGWDGAFLTVDVDGTPTNYTTGASTSTYNVNIADGASVIISYTAGSYETEHSYVITRPNGSTFSAGPSPATGVVLSETNTCPVPTSCDAPDITQSNVTASAATISWLSTNQGGNWTLSWAPEPFDVYVDTPEGTLTGVTAGIESHMISGLSSETLYRVCLVEDCDDMTPSSPTCITFTTGVINDLCSGALPIDCDDLISGSTVNATPSPTLLGTTGGSEAAKDVWYVFTGYNQDDLGALPGTPGNEVQLATCELTSPGSALYDTKIDVYSGSCGTLTWVNGNDDYPGCSLHSSISIPTVVGEVYYVRVYGFNAGSQGSFVLSMQCESPCLPVPSNGVCTSPTTIALQPFATAPNISGTNECSPAGVYPGCGSTFSTYAGSWYEFNSGPTGEVYVELALGTIAPGTLGFALYNTAPCDGTTSAVICVTDFGGIAPSQILLTPNTNYKINVFTVQGNEGTYTFVVTGPPPPPANDECANATEVPVTPGLTCTGGTAATFYGATESTSPDTDLECGVQGAQKDVWMKFTVPASGRVQMNYTPVSIGTLQPRWSLYRSATDCTGMTFVSGSCTTTDPRVLPAYGASSALALIPGETMYVRLWAPTNSFTGNFTFCVTDPVPANNLCVNATPVAVSEFGTPAWTTGTSSGAFGGNACAGTANEQVWYSFVATDPTHVVLARPVGTGNYNAVIEVFDACGGTSLGCFNNYGASAIERALVSGLTPGNTYRYSVHHQGGAGTASSDAHETFVQGFFPTQLQAAYCGATMSNLSQSIYSQRDDQGQMYANPIVGVNGYGFRFQEIPSGIDVVVQNPVTDGFYMQLLNIPGIQYGKSYNVSIQHRVVVPGNGTTDVYWSGFGPACQVNIGTTPTTNIRPQFCTGASDFYLGDQLLAVQMAAATQYRFNFTPTGGGATISELSANYAVSLYNVGPLGGPGLQYGLSYNVTVEALIAGTWTPVGSSCTINMATQPEDTAVRPSYCGGTYLFPQSNFLLAETVLGASMYEYKFTPSLGGTALTEIKSGISFAFHLTSLPFVSGTTYDVEVRAFAGGVWGDYSGMCSITIQGNPEAQGGNDAQVAAKKLDASAIASLYPNPNLGENLYISLTDLEDKPQHIVVEVLDVTGKMVYVQDVANNGKTANILINFNEKLSKGMYFVNIYMDQTMITEKLTVE